VILAWFVSLAWAEEPPVGWTPLPPPEPVEEGAPVTEMLIVGGPRIAAARAALVESLAGQGWTTRDRARRDGAIVVIPPESWMGRLLLHPDGRLDFANPAIHFDPALAASIPNGRSPFADSGPSEASSGQFGMVERGKQRAVQDALRGAIEPQVVAWREAIASRATAEALAALEARLVDLWVDGIGLGRESLPTPAARRAALLDYWATRTDTPEGRAAMRIVEAFLRNRVQTSADPVTADEAAAAAARRDDGRPLDLSLAPSGAGPSPMGPQDADDGRGVW
jgi:hypothetical protein